MKKQKSKSEQISFETILADSFRAHERRMLRYMSENADLYRGFAQVITPIAEDRLQAYTRIAFSILSANTNFNFAVEALSVAVEKRGILEPNDLAPYGMVPAKAKFCNELWVGLETYVYWKYEGETWSQYRYRLQSLFKGLGIAKASFAACLLYPLEADLACIDTWMQKVFLGNTGFKSLGKAQYERVEARVRKYARRFGVSTFLAQWMIWDHARGGTPNAHAIFPGSHKDTVDSQPIPF